MKGVLLMLLIIGLLLEMTLTSLPLVLVFLLILTVWTRRPFVFVLAFCAGLCIDVAALNPIGETCIYLLCFLFLILLYRRKYEIYSFPFVIFASFAGSSIYLLLLGGNSVLYQGLVCAFITFIVFGFIQLASGAGKKAVL
jgi:hypothetical protein